MAALFHRVCERARKLILASSLVYSYSGLPQRTSDTVITSRGYFKPYQHTQGKSSVWCCVLTGSVQVAITPCVVVQVTTHQIWFLFYNVLGLVSPVGYFNVCPTVHTVAHVHLCMFVKLLQTFLGCEVFTSVYW